MRSKVDLPQPEGPSSTRSSRSAKSHEIWFATFLPPELLLTPRRDMAAMMDVSAKGSALDAAGGHAGGDIALHEKVEDDGGQRVHQPDGHHGMHGGAQFPDESGQADRSGLQALVADQRLGEHIFVPAVEESDHGSGRQGG